MTSRTLAPEQNIVGVDMGVESLERAMARFGSLRKPKQNAPIRPTVPSPHRVGRGSG